MELIEFDLVVLDVMMPGESGFDLTTWVRSKAETSKTPVLLLTARGDPDDRIEGLSRGADDYMSKPFDPRELALRVDAILRRTGGKPLTPARSSWVRQCSTWSGWNSHATARCSA